MSAKILIVAGDLPVQELLKTAAEGRGYNADVASDGFTAVQLFRKGDYELALIDDELPELDAYATARMMRGLTEGKELKAYALSGNVAALQKRTGANEIFDGIIAKPFDVLGLLQLIEKEFYVPRHSQLMNAALRLWRDCGLPHHPVAKVVPPPSHAQATVLRPWFDLTNFSTADMILLTNASAAGSFAEARMQSDTFLLPVVELEGIDSGFADATFDVHRKDSWANVAATIKRFEAKKTQLSDSARDAQDLDTKLLTNLFLSERPLEPTVDPSRPICVGHRGFASETELIVAAERLAHRGFLSQKFVDRFHCCSACDSNRLNVREECPCCRSANLQQTELIHHFRCAYQAPEAHFRSGSHLICPKCSQHLRHYGGDYDKPGSVLICNNCYALNSDPAIGFSCLDCGTHIDGDAAKTRDLFSYSLTPRAESFLTQPVPMAPSDKVPSLDVVPKPIAEAIDKVISANSESLKGLAIIEVEYRAQSSILDLEGGKAFASLRRLFIENMTNVLAEHAYIITHDNADYIVVHENDEVTSGSFVQDLFNHCQAGLSRNLDPSYRIIGSADLRPAA